MGQITPVERQQALRRCHELLRSWGWKLQSVVDRFLAGHIMGKAGHIMGDIAASDWYCQGNSVDSVGSVDKVEFNGPCSIIPDLGI